MICELQILRVDKR